VTTLDCSDGQRAGHPQHQKQSPHPRGHRRCCDSRRRSRRLGPGSGVRGEIKTRVQPGVLRPIEVRTQVLSDVVASGVLAHFVDRDCVTTAVHLERHFPTLEDRHLFRIEKVPLICAGVAGATNDAGCRRAPSPGKASRWGEHTETDDGWVLNRRVLVREVAFLAHPTMGSITTAVETTRTPTRLICMRFSFATRVALGCNDESSN
jgi:hypothetical protein